MRIRWWPATHMAASLLVSSRPVWLFAGYPLKSIERAHYTESVTGGPVVLRTRTDHQATRE